MARSYSIAQVIQSGGPGTPGRIILQPAAGNLVTSFQGKFYRNSVGATLPGYTVSPPSTYSLIVATTFTISGNASYNGTYTVYSPTSGVDPNPSSVFSGTQTNILVNEVVGPAAGGDATNTGTVSNISTYLIAIAGEASLIVPPTVQFVDRPMDVVGRFGTPWGESVIQNFIELAQNSAGGSAPVNPYLGQTWYDSTLNAFNLRTAGGWVTLATGVPGANTTYRHTQGAASTTWIITHNLGLLAPYVALVQFFVDVGGGVYKMMLPSDLSFDSANQMTVTFTSAQTGIALIRA